MSIHEQKPQQRVHRRLDIPPLTRTSIPPVEQLKSPSPMWPWLYSSVLGNGHLLVCLDEVGSIAQLFYPYIDAGPHVRSFLFGVKVQDAAQADTFPVHASNLNQQDHGTATSAVNESPVSWLASNEWTHELHYVEGAATIQCKSVNYDLGMQVDQIMAVHPEHDILMIEIKATNLRRTPINCKFVTYAGLNIDYRRSGNTSYFDVEASMLTFFALDRYISIAGDAPVSGFACDKCTLGELDFIFLDASEGQFSGREYAIGLVSASLCHDFGTLEAGKAIIHNLNLCFGRSLEEVKRLSSSLEVTRARIEETIESWREQYAHSQLSVGSTIIKNLYNRSLITLKLLTDNTGGIIAAPECDPDFRSCGGYGPCWPRDGAFIGHALDSNGQYDHARMFYDWALNVQSEAGVWYQRYYVNGQLAPTWGLVQFDETGAVVWSICRHIQLTDDIAYGQKAFPKLVLACEYMQSKLDPETGLAPMTKDVWEERDGISTYACASTWGGFHELAELSLKLGKIAEARRWGAAATQLKTSIERHLWDDDHRRFLRGMKTRIHPQDVEQLRRKAEFSESDIIETEFAGKPRYFQRRDAVVDASILGLSIPFGVFSSEDPRMIATADAIVAHLSSPIGGIRRYQDDPYRGGNPWVICSLWMALQDIAAGQSERALKLYDWVVEHRTSLDLLPEQVDIITGQPCWVVPLGWSHAMFILVSQALAEKGLLE